MNLFKRILISPFFGACIAALAVIAGAIISLYADEIKRSFPIYFSFNYSSYSIFSFPTFFFWITFLLFFLLTAIRQFNLDTETNNQRESLINTLQSLPPHDFAIKYRVEYANLEKIRNNIKILISSCKINSSKKMEQCDLEVIEQTIRLILDSYINLAKIWDNPESSIDESIIYRANIMFYCSINNLSTSIKNNILTMNNFFVDKNIDAIISSIDGLLVLEDSKFTTTTETNKPTPDQLIKPLLLPVTFCKSKGKRYQNLPGAPKALIEKKTQWINNTTEIIEICKNEDHFDGEILKKIEKYYITESKARSIISMPLNSEDDNGIPIGVVNIYRNKKMILRSEVRSEEFSSFLLPFNVLLCDVLFLYVEAYSLFNTP